MLVADQSMSTYAKLYTSRGWNVLPCHPGEKRPAVRYAQWWTEKAPADLVDRHECTAIQVMLGRHWRLLVIDLDGSAAVEWWESEHGRRTPRTWVTHSGGGGRHLWFRLPEHYARPLPKAVLWTDGEKHSAVERLCDNSLIVAPPSLHPKTGRRYQYLDKAHSPYTLPMPATAASWLLHLPTLTPVVAAPAIRAVEPINVTPYTGKLPRTADIVAAIPDKIGLAKSWGVRFTGRKTPKGWHECHAIDRPDDKPSAAVHHEGGYYYDQGSAAKLSLLDLAVAIGVYRDWREASTDLANRYGVRAS